MENNYILQDQYGFWLRAGGRRGEGISSRRFGKGKEKEKETDKVKNHQLLRDGIQADCALLSGDDTGE